MLPTTVFVKGVAKADVINHLPRTPSLLTSGKVPTLVAPEEAIAIESSTQNAHVPLFNVRVVMAIPVFSSPTVSS